MHKSASLANVEYDCTVSYFSDVIQVMVYKNSKITKMFECSLPVRPGHQLRSDIVLASIETRPLLGSNTDDAVGLMYAEILATAVAQDPEESRTIIVGFGDLGPKQGVTHADRDELEVVRRLVEVDAR